MTKKKLNKNHLNQFYFIIITNNNKFLISQLKQRWV